MGPALLPTNEVERLAALRRYAILDTLPEATFEGIADLAHQAFSAPIVLISFMDLTRQWFKARRGFGKEQIGRDLSFCAYAILGTSVMEVPDATLDPRFAAHPLVVGEPHLRFYAAAPLRAPGGFNLGTLALFDVHPRQLTEAQRQMLAGFAALIVETLELRLQTLREEAEGRHAKTELAERFQLVSRATNDAVWDWNLGTNALWWSEGFTTLFGYREDQIEPGLESWTSRLHPGDAERVLAGIHAVVDTGGVAWSAEYRFRRADGSWAEILDRGYVMHDERRVPVRMIGAMMDISERKRADEALRASEARFRALIENSTDGISVSSAEGAVIYRSPSTARMLGRPPGTAKSPMMEYLHPEDRAAFAEVWAALLASPRVPIPALTRVLHADGSWRTLDAVLVNLLDDPAVRGIVSNFRDVTERQQLEARLRMADRMASVGTLAAGVAHEINNPLAYIQGNLDFALDHLERGVDSPAVRAEVTTALLEAREGTGRVRVIVRDLKTFSRPDETLLGAVDVQRVLESTIHMAFNEIRHRARLVTDFGPVPPVAANDARLGQIFLNLLVNAAQAIPEGAAEANEIRVTTATDAAGRAVIAIRDTGSGMSPDLQRRIFDPFFTTKPIGVGTGLGLSICQGIVHSLGGEIAVQSEPGKGSEFRVTLPATQPEVAAPPAPGQQAPARRGRLLVVDDEPLVGRALHRMLSAEHAVKVLDSGKKALDDLLGGARYDLILCDLMMPEMTGMELHAALVRHDPAQAARMLFLTGGAFTGAARAFLERVPNVRLEKPFNAAELCGLVRSQLL